MYSNSKFKLGNVATVDPADNPILIKNLDPQPDPVPRTPVAKPPQTGGANPAEIVAGSRSGLGRLQKAGLGSSVYDTVANTRPVAKSPASGGFNPPSGMLPQTPVAKPRSAPRTYANGGIAKGSRPLNKPTTSGGYDGSGINPSAGKPNAGKPMSGSVVTRNPKLNARAPRGRKGFLR